VKSYVPGDQWQYNDSKHIPAWRDCIGDPLWNFDTRDYRKKPEPAVIYASQFRDGVWGGCSSHQDEAERYGNLAHTIRVAVKFVEEV
jgi:hypothetical protein